MKTLPFMVLLTLTFLLTTHSATAPASAIQQGQSAGAFTGDKTSWHGFDRYDFLMDDAALTFQPIKASPEEGTGAGNPVQGKVRCVVVVPKKAAAGNPWSWRGRYFDHEPQSEVELLNRGFHIAFVESEPGKHWDAWYSYLTTKHALHAKPAFIGMSGGGRSAYTWATLNPDRVSSIYADNTLITREALMKLGELAQRDVPLLHICGSVDPLTPLHTLPVESLYQQLGGRISVMIKDGAGHHPHSLRNPTLVADFIERALEPARSVPAYAGKNSVNTSFYSDGATYREFPEDGTFVTCRGPLFSGSYDRYQFKPEGISGTVTVIAPVTAAAGKPWVMRADFVPRDAAVDLALLQRGFHIVTAARPRDPAVTLLQEWDATYRHLVDHGFSRKPVLEGAGMGARDAYAWAIANPDKVSCVYGENPVLRSGIAKGEPLDRLALLAKAGIPILHVCGSLDPWFKSQTQVAERRYSDLGGRLTVILKEGEGHIPLSPKDPRPVLDFILKAVSAGK